MDKNTQIKIKILLSKGRINKQQKKKQENMKTTPLSK